MTVTLDRNAASYEKSSSKNQQPHDSESGTSHLAFPVAVQSRVIKKIAVDDGAPWQ